MMWRDFYKIEWAIFDETLIIKYNNEETPFYMMPVGANPEGAIEALGNATFVGICNDVNNDNCNCGARYGGCLALLES